MTTYLTGQSLFDPWITDIRTNKPILTWTSGDDVFQHVDIAPGRLVLLAGQPGAGKTAFLLQWMFGLLFENPSIKVFVANVEMPAQGLLDRQLARLTNVPLTTINRRQISSVEMQRVGTGALRIATIMDRLAFASRPHDLENIQKEANDFDADILCLDYVQRIQPVDPKKRAANIRERINVLTSELRTIATCGKACVVAAASAVSRVRDSKGRSSYQGQHLSMASLRESGELEFGCDDCLILCPTGNSANNPVQDMLLRHEKSRYGEPTNVALQFERKFQRFKRDPFAAMGATRNGQLAPAASKRSP